MTSKKFKLKRIVKNNARKARIRKTILELAEEVSELKKVWGLNVFIIMYGRGDSIPVIWPPRPETKQWLQRLQSFPEAERIKDVTTQEYLQGRTAMNQELLCNVGTKNVQMNLLLHRYHQQGKSFANFSTDESCNLFFYVEEKNLELNKRITYVNGLVQAEGDYKPQVPDQGFIAGHSSTKN